MLKLSNLEQGDSNFDVIRGIEQTCGKQATWALVLEMYFQVVGFLNSVSIMFGWICLQFPIAVVPKVFPLMFL